MPGWPDVKKESSAHWRRSVYVYIKRQLPMPMLALFDAPDTFDISRSPNHHLAFGIGEHFCLGANLARLEIRILFEEILRRLPDMEIAGEVRRLRSSFIDGIKEIPVRFTPESKRATQAA